MERHEDEIRTNPNLYPEELQLKLYQAFIFSIPILFAIILFLLFYLFYLKRRANNNMSTHPRLQQSVHHSVSFLSPPWSIGIKGEIKDKLQVIQFDEELRAKDSLCCVCLGEFELKEELRQLPLCKHVFHGDCIRLWLRTNGTCPLCRCHVMPALKMGRPIGLGPDLVNLGNGNSISQIELENVGSSSTSEVHNSTRTEEHVIEIADEIPSSSNNAS
ncbi:probable E3 ubiquitin-protein ligase RHA4A [Chenopodium quinoa]|nr:probable E3 ubiquitin-protein ligase RHA4A [Chenopodium quinoa]